MAIETKKVVLILIDISGYTQFMVKNRETVHSQLVIGEILQEIIDQAKLPLRVAKLEGDAIFLYAEHQHEHLWQAEKQKIGRGLEEFFTVFADELVKLSQSKLCRSNSCKNIDKLKLKIFVHEGEALFQKIHQYDELAGVDVILVHRLLKNSVKADHYILFTERAYQEIDFPHGDEMKKHTEDDSDLGAIKTYLYIPPDVPCVAHGSKE